ncbi:hypothetical protein Tco_0929533 [Tanacetum coccineum]
MRKHGYGYLEEIVVRRADNILYKFKEGDFLRLRINDIEDMLILVVQNRLTNLLGDDVADFAIALRMFTKSLVIQKRVEDHQLRVKSYQKNINVTKPDTTRPDLRKRHPDGTLTRLLSSLEDITKNIDMEYLPKRRLSLMRQCCVDESDTYVLERFDTSAGNSVKEILMIFKDGGEDSTSRIPIIKVRWNSKRGPEFTWECED